MEIKIKDIERYQSSDSSLFRNLPVGSYGSIFNDESGHRPIRPEAYIHGGGSLILKDKQEGLPNSSISTRKKELGVKRSFENVIVISQTRNMSTSVNAVPNLTSN